MRDKIAREQIENALKQFNESIVRGGALRSDINNIKSRLDSHASVDSDLYNKLALLAAELAALKENLRPVCRTCGQKIQDGFKPGDIGKIAAAVKKSK